LTPPLGFFGGRFFFLGAAERECRCEKLRERLVNSMMFRQLVERSGSVEDLRWCLEFCGARVLHSGCGMGLNRIPQFMLGSDNLRATTAFQMN
jgi:aspartyl/asparaginyl-tRNA synthetase